MNRNRFQELIKKSRERCEKLGLNEERISSRKIIEHTELQAKFAENRDLILTASPYMEHLMSIVKGDHFFVLLTDREGCILNAIGDEKILSEAFDLKMVAGAYMNEENIGTNAMSLVIKSRSPIQLSGKDHFIKAYHRWTCSGAPIKDVNGNLIGVLDLTGYSDSVHPHTLGMVTAASNAIEEMLKFKAYNKLQNMTNKHIKTIFNSMPVAIVTADINGNIKIYNQQAMDLFGNRQRKMIGNNISELIEEWDEIREGIEQEKNVSRIVNIRALKNRFLCQMMASPIYNPQDDSIEIVFVLREEKNNKKHMMVSPYYTFDKIMGEEVNFRRTVEYAKKIAGNRSTILIMGESGTGKEVFAQSIHNFSKRVDGPFVALNCGAIPNQLIEAELFGYEDGAYTGAKKGGNIGKFEEANKGTIMLDEIGEMPIDMQTRLLRVLQESVITRIGSHKAIPIDVRIIAATNKDLKKEVALGRFRKDLFYRLNVLPLFLPPLRERKEDILQLFYYFLKNTAIKYDKVPIALNDEELKILTSYTWPGNIRELENIAELIVNTEDFPYHYFKSSRNKGGGFESYDFSQNLMNDSFLVGLEKVEDLSLEHMERIHLARVLKLYEGNITKSAQALGIQRNTLYSKIKKYEIDIEQ
ncbi:sigma 54-interacting transcriptional regulator [Eubacteriaceae bacterium ES3]|nr:sigma 54-interacting transcriptional regulator [Eubacteriaceae bacterium ES3]